MRQDSFHIADVMPVVRESGLLSSTCTITRVGTDFTDAGEPTNAYTEVDGLVDIPCISAPLNTGDRGILEERRDKAETQSEVNRHILLDGYYPQITEGDRAVVDDVAFDISTAESDSQSQMTRLLAKRVTI